MFCVRMTNLPEVGERPRVGPEVLPLHVDGLLGAQQVVLALGKAHGHRL